MDFTFVVPLRSAKVSSDWARVVQLLEDTVGAALASRDVQVKVVIACDEIPPLHHAVDPRVTFLSRAYPVPATPAHQMLDKRFKKYDLIRHVLDTGGGYVMLLDSDDLVSDKLASYVLKTDNRHGHVVTDGYVLDADSRAYESVADFDQRCGSSVIVYIDPADKTSAFNWPLYVSVTQHKDFRRLSAGTPRPFDAIPFPAVIALRNNGENHSSRFRGQGNTSIQRRVVDFIRGRRPSYFTPEAEREFGLVRN